MAAYGMYDLVTYGNINNKQSFFRAKLHVEPTILIFDTIHSTPCIGLEK